MKLIIDIDNDYYEIIKYRVEHGDDYKPYTLIANGMPYKCPSCGVDMRKDSTEKVKIKSTKDLINNIAGFDVSGIKPLPEYQYGISDAEQKGGAE